MYDIYIAVGRAGSDGFLNEKRNFFKVPIAINSWSKNKSNGETDTYTKWVYLCFYNQAAVNAHEKIKKGYTVFFEGSPAIACEFTDSTKTVLKEAQLQIKVFTYRVVKKNREGIIDDLIAENARLLHDNDTN